MNELFGMKIFASPLVQPVPVLQVSPTFQWCTDEVRADMNALLLELFGTKEVAYIFHGDALGLHYGKAMFINPKQVVQLKNFIP